MQLICILDPSSQRCRLMLPVHSTFLLSGLPLSILLPSVSRRQTDFLLLDLLLLFNIKTLPVFRQRTMLPFLLFSSSAVLHLSRNLSISRVSTYPHRTPYGPSKVPLLEPMWRNDLQPDASSKSSFLTGRIFESLILWSTPIVEKLLGDSFGQRTK